MLTPVLKFLNDYIFTYLLHLYFHLSLWICFFSVYCFFLGEQHQVVNITYTSSSKYPLYKYLINLRLYYMYIGKSSMQTMRVQIIYIFCKKQYTYINQTWAISPLLGLIAYFFHSLFFSNMEFDWLWVILWDIPYKPFRISVLCFLYSCGQNILLLEKLFKSKLMGFE